jgi:hypothetical protein
MSGPQSRRWFHPPVHLLGSVASLAVGAAVFGCSSDPEGDGRNSDTPSGQAALDSGVRAGDAASSAPNKRVDGGSLGSIPVGADSPACAANLPFHPPGCPCSDKDDVASCWSGPPGDRNRGSCRDGTQLCANQGEFRAWTACGGEQRDCGGAAPDAGAPEECECVPGTKILCSEDCEQLIICSLTGTKTCQPDGKFGPCKEEFLAGLDGVVACKSLYYKCLFADEGIYVGDCDSTFTCGHPPGFPPLVPPAETPVDAGVDAGPQPPVVQ